MINIIYMCKKRLTQGKFNKRAQFSSVDYFKISSEISLLVKNKVSPLDDKISTQFITYDAGTDY